jgi:hypothetical protein
VFHATLVALTTIWINQTIKICNDYIHDAAFINAGTHEMQSCDVAWKIFPQHYWQAVLSRHLGNSTHFGDLRNDEAKRLIFQMLHSKNEPSTHLTNCHLLGGFGTRRKFTHQVRVALTSWFGFSDASGCICVTGGTVL